MKAKIILVALALFLGAIGYTVQAQCSADCQCGKTTEDKTLADQFYRIIGHPVRAFGRVQIVAQHDAKNNDDADAFDRAGKATGDGADGVSMEGLGSIPQNSTVK